MIPIADGADNDMPIRSCLVHCDSDAAMVNNLDDDETWAEDWLRNPKLDPIFECWFDTTGNGLTPLNGKDMTTPLGDGIGVKRDLFLDRSFPFFTKV